MSGKLTQSLHRAHAIVTRGYAAAPSANKVADAAAARARQHSLTGSHNELLKRVLFEPGVRPTIPSKRDGEVMEQEETVIKQAWALEQEHLESRRNEERKRKFLAMKEAHDILKQESETLYKGAVWRDVAPLFPRQMRIPTQTPPKVIWDYTWKAPDASSS
ncbi:hypothetical protein BJ684DRAFT_19219 [Piptocephalis cylindrospora]|uniref:Large ribosomal subunit protein mL40 n=1 Tax=Piptocephalis cylindrospora TaxID=1907219 RepID=A0A4P9Y5Z8_9FUNG|nr:hypothetical protein BJ684DRAFT_19219 [Piptocephalis cylindrospora]|eukprot:RKP14375.1 hypothetical protein BJ684DRAFT_19219 [Piptocephalis cylindrospora]